MKRYLVVTIDVEPDCSPSWHYSNPLEFNGVSVGIRERLHPLFAQYDIVPTYLINNVVLEDAPSIEVLRSLAGKYELGAHLHPEFIAPAKQHETYAGQKGIANCCFYPPDIEFEKIKSITALFKQAFGYQPTGFRAGRFSAGNNTMRSLAELGYLVDTSITPHVCWNDSSREKPVDFSSASEQPYFMKPGSMLQQDPAGKLLQVPVSIALKKRNPVREFIVSGAGLRHPIRTSRPVWLRPYYSKAAEMKYIVEQYLSAYQDHECVVFNMMFHNVEVLPGLSPYTNTENDCLQYMQELQHFFAFCRQKEISSIGLSDLYDVFRK